VKLFEGFWCELVIGPRDLNMRRQLIEPTGDLNIVASENSSPNDFDFLVGQWNIHNRKLNSRLNDCQQWTEFEALGRCRKILNGFGNIDDFRTESEGAPFEGISLRLFNPKTKLWSIYWADSNLVVLDVPQVGSFDGNIGIFYARDIFEAKEIIIQFKWDKTIPDAPVWSQAFSSDNGNTWEWNWHMTFLPLDHPS
jgi:hypothetical protein